MTSILDKLLVARFYKLNAGFFLVLFIALFGVMNGKDTIDFHHAIMVAATGGFLPFCAAVLVCTAYNFKCIAFCIKELNEPVNSFLFNLQAADNKGQFSLLLRSHASVYFPLLLYFCIGAYVGFSNGHYVLSIALLLWQLIMCAAGAGIYFYTLNTTWKRPLISLPSLVFPKKKNFSLYLLLYSLHNRKGTFIFIKIFSLILLQFLVLLNSDKISRENICFLIMFVIATHALLPLYYMRYMETELSFMRNMPLSLIKRFSVFVLTYAIIFLPELLFLLWNERGVLPLQVIISLYAVAVARLSLYTAIQYVKAVNTDRYTFVVMALFFVSLLLLASFSLWLFFAVESVVAMVMFGVLYYSYERVDMQAG